MNIVSTRLALPAALSLALWSSIARADTAVPIDLPTAIRLTLAQPVARAGDHEVAATQALADGAGAWPNPTLEYLREGQQAGSRTTTFQINQPIELGGKRQARSDLAAGALAQARAELALRRQELRAETVLAYHTVGIARERQALATALVDLARQGAQAARKRVAAGKAAPLDETRARLALADASAGLAQAEGQLAIATSRLGALTGTPAQNLVLAAPSAHDLPEVPPLASLLDRLEDGAALGRARGQLATRIAQGAVERAARVPDLTLSVGSQREDGIPRRQAVVGLSVALPLFNRNSANLGAALRRADQARDELAAARTSLGADLLEARTRYEVAKNEAALLRGDVLPSARSAHALTLKGFEHGKFSFLDVLEAQRTLYQVSNRLCDTLLGAWRAHADIERLAGAGTTTTSGSTLQEPTP